MKFLWILGLLAAVGIVAAAPPISDFPGIHALGLDRRSFCNPIDSSANDIGCGSQPKSEPRFYNSVTKGECVIALLGFYNIVVDCANEY